MRSLLRSAVLLAVFAGCSDDTKTAAPQPAPSVAATGTATAAATADNAAAAAPAEPVCTVVEHSVIAKGANPRTGLTPQRLGKGVALGVAIGDRPHRLEIDAEGKLALSRPTIAAGHPLAEHLDPKKGVRHLQRVTVTGGGASFADYRDKYEDGKRRVACGPLHQKDPYLVYDGAPLLDTDDSGRGRTPTPPARPSDKPAGEGGGAPQGDVAEPPAPRGPAVELRDCRTFADGPGSDVWSVGSELVSETKDEKTIWKMRFFVVPKAGEDRRVVLYAADLGENPKKLHTLEAPIAHRLADGSYVLAGRYQGKMLAWLLGADKSKKSDLRQYAGGYPGLPRVVDDGASQLLLTSQKVDLSNWKLRALRLPNPPKLAEKFLQPVIEGEGSAAEPTVARLGDQRWLSFHAGERRDGRIHVVPVDEELKAVGQSFAVTAEEAAAYESHLFAIGDELLLVYISRPDVKKPPELVADRLRCSVQK